MYISLRIKILLAVLLIVLLFTFFSLHYFPKQQRQMLYKSYNSQIQNFAKSIASGVQRAVDAQDFQGIHTALAFARNNSPLKIAELRIKDTIWQHDSTQFSIRDSVFASFPEHEPLILNSVSNDTMIVNEAPFHSSIMNGSIVLAFSSDEIKVGQRKIKFTSLVVSGLILLIGLLIGLWLARNISLPVSALRNAADRVGKGDLTPTVKNNSRDEIGDLTKAFNNMVQDIKRLSELSITQEKEKQQLLASQNEMLEKQVVSRTEKLKQSLEDLRSAQSQLIQSEKMASLGELTAGIAHEIQNPLNFVNNFSEISAEMIDELKAELSTRNIQQALRIADNIKENEEKISHHGKRADAIVKSMLQHSRNSSGQKELVDINKLADEYLRLAFHGMRGKDKTFNAKIETNLNASIELINVVPQEIGRVLLNLFNNAFYTVSERQKGQGEINSVGMEAYKPMVSVSTKRLNGYVEIKVKDNGNGIPKNIVDKIFQPFFTTKPAGQGTGLGLSLAYDIIKVHGGEIKVDTKEGDGSEFTVLIPVQKMA